MNRQTFNLMTAQYRLSSISGQGLVSWEDGRKCVLPSLIVYGASVQEDTPSPDLPASIACNNADFSVCGRNLFSIIGRQNKDAGDFSSTAQRDFTGNGIYPGLTNSNYNQPRLVTYSTDSQTGDITVTSASAGYGLAFDIAAVPGGTYTVTASAPVCLSEFDSAGGVLRYSHVASSLTYTVGTDCRWITLLLRPPENVATTYQNTRLELSSVSSEDARYWSGGTVTAPDLHGFSDTQYCDEWNAVTGQGFRRTSVLTLDGSEEWKLTSNGYYFGGLSPSGNPNYGCCTHVPYDYAYLSGQGFFVHDSKIYNYRNDLWPTLEEWKTFLADQAAAGTPVTVIYVLKEPQSFDSPPAQRLTMPTGFGQVMQTGGDIPDTGITVRYLTHS